MIVDLKTSTEVSFTVPYVSTRPYFFCAQPESDALGANGQEIFNAVSGIIRVEVLNQLVASNSVTQAIDVLVEVNGGPDLTFAGPGAPNFRPFSGQVTNTFEELANWGEGEQSGTENLPDVVPQTKPTEKEPASNNIEKQTKPNPSTTSGDAKNSKPQSGTTGTKVVKNDQKSQDKTNSERSRNVRVTTGSHLVEDEDSEYATAQMMGDNEQIPRNEAQLGEHPESIDKQTIHSNWSPEALCIGEKVTSVRQLIKRQGIIAKSIPLNNTNPSLLIAPFGFQNPTAAVSTQRPYGCLVDYFFNIYGFYRGQMRYKMLTEGRTNFIVSMCNTMQDAMLPLVDSFNLSAFPYLRSRIPFNTLRSPQSTTFVSTDIEGAIELQVPYYNSSHISPCVGYTVGITSPISRQSVLRGFVPPIVLGVTPARELGTNDTVDVTLTKGAADDFSFMYILGPPPLVPINFKSIT
jgi:hypothetical protein